MARCLVRAKLRYLCVVLVGAICWGCVKPEEVGSEGCESFFNGVAGIMPKLVFIYDSISDGSSREGASASAKRLTASALRG